MDTSPMTIRRETVERWRGLAEAARRAGVTPTQIRRHVDGTAPSGRLARRLAAAGVRIERAR